MQHGGRAPALAQGGCRELLGRPGARAGAKAGTCVCVFVAGPGVEGMGECVRLHFNLSLRAAWAVGARGSLTALLHLQHVSCDAGLPLCVDWHAGGSLSTPLFDSQASKLKIRRRAGWLTVAMPLCATSCVRSSGSRGPARARENFRRVCPTRVSNRAPPRAIELLQRQ